MDTHLLIMRMWFRQIYIDTTPSIWTFPVKIANVGYKSAMKTQKWIFALPLPTHQNALNHSLLGQNKRLSFDLTENSPSLKPHPPTTGLLRSPLEKARLSWVSVVKEKRLLTHFRVLSHAFHTSYTLLLLLIQVLFSLQQQTVENVIIWLVMLISIRIWVLFGCLKLIPLQQFHFLYHSCCLGFSSTDIKAFTCNFVPFFYFKHISAC